MANMDNIQKMIVGCLVLVGLIVMILPNSDPLASKKSEADQTSPADETLPPPPPPPLAQPSGDGTASGNFVVNDSDIANFGKPMVDPTPLGERNQRPQQELTQQQPQQQYGTSINQKPGAITNYGSPQFGGEATAEGPNIPLEN